jgi:hypothetical protein
MTFDEKGQVVKFVQPIPSSHYLELSFFPQYSVGPVSITSGIEFAKLSAEFKIFDEYEHFFIINS